MRKKQPARPAVEPWQATKHAEIKKQPEPFFLHLLVDLNGANLIAHGELPEYVIQQAIDALRWQGEPLDEGDNEPDASTTTTNAVREEPELPGLTIRDA